MKPLNKFRMLTNAPFFILVNRDEDGGIGVDAIKKFFKLTERDVLNKTNPRSFNQNFFLTLGGLN
jgi:hypothetical protein